MLFMPCVGVATYHICTYAWPARGCLRLGKPMSSPEIMTKAFDSAMASDHGDWRSKLVDVHRYLCCVIIWCAVRMTF